MKIRFTINSIFSANNFFESVVGFCANLQRLGEASSTSREKHKFLEGKLVSSVRTTIDNIESWSGKNKRGLDTSQISQVLVQRDTFLSRCCFSDSDGNTKDRISTQRPLVGRTVELDKEVVDVFLLENGETGLDKCRCDDIVYVSDSLADTFPRKLERVY
jgi:hypothetical protein